jgi:RNA polymerase sigma-70 factor (ECF subfamily)
MLDRVSNDAAEAVFDKDENEELLQKLEVALTQLNVEEKMLITLYYTEDRSVAEIASIMELTGDNVKIKLYRIRKKLYVLINANQSS